MRKKKEKHESPVYNKKNDNKTTKSRSKCNILNYHNDKINTFMSQKTKLTNELKKSKDDDKIRKINDELKKVETNEMEYLLQSVNIIQNYMCLEEKEHQNIDSDDKDAILYEIYKQKNDLSNEYMKLIDPNFNETIKITKFEGVKNDLVCKYCETVLDIDNGYSVCLKCGYCIRTLETSSDPSYKEMQDYVYKPQFTYQKESHLDDWIRRFQAKENRIIEQVVLDKIILEAKKQRITDLNNLTEDKVKKFLKNLNLNDYYDNVIAIINRLNGRPPFTLTTEIENKIKVMFRQIQEPFLLYKPPSRKNFLSYSYILHQFFKILGLNEFTKYFPLLKSTDKLRQQDDIFKKIVEHMAERDKSINWKFYPTV
jgi:hypothetical protein